MNEKERSEFLNQFHVDVMAEIEALVPVDQLKNIMLKRARELRARGEGEYFCVKAIDTICYYAFCHVKGNMLNELEASIEELKKLEKW